MEKQQLYLAGQGLHGEVHCSLFTKGCIQDYHPLFYANERHESQQPDLHLLYYALYSNTGLLRLENAQPLF